MESYEALGTAINRKTAVHARALGLSLPTVHKWQEPSADFSDSGAYNPLDRIETIMATSLHLGNPTEVAMAPVFYLANRFSFIPLFSTLGTSDLPEISRQLNRVVAEFGNLIRESADALDDGKVSPAERRQIERAGMNLFTQLGHFMYLIKEAAK